MQNKTFRLFISSPFSDFTKEREVLHKRVFPKIEEYCNQHHLSFQPVDLRWGVNEEAQLDQKTLEVCLEEVRACKHFPHPNFLIMAGDRYGYVPCPYMIEESEFEKLKENILLDNEITIKYKGTIPLENWKTLKKHLDKNIKYEILETEEKKDEDSNVKVEFDVLKRTNNEELLSWYKLDKNQLPTSYILNARENEYEEYDIWKVEEDLLRDVLQEAAKHIFKSKEDKEYQKYFLSATEQEAIEGICQFKNKTDSQKHHDAEKDEKYIFGYTRSIEKIDNSEDNQIYLDRLNKEPVPELKAKADGFKIDLQKLLKDNVFPSRFPSVKEYNANELTKFEEYITEKLKSAINEQLPKTENLTKQEEQKLKLEQEILEQTKFLKDKVKGFQGREKTLTVIKKYLTEHTTEPLIIHGPSGMGKSSLMAEAIFRTDNNRDEENKKIETDAIFRFVGATASSTTIRDLLISIVDQLQDKKVIDKIDEYKVDDNEFFEQIKNTLESIEQPTILFIDALDQLEYKEYLNWLPEELDLNVKIILTLLNDEKYKKDTHYYNLLTERYDNNTMFIDITKDSLEEKKEKLIKDLLEIEHRKLNQAQTVYLLEQWAKTGYSPLYLKISIEEVKHWKHCEDEDGTPILCKKQKLESSVEEIIREYFENLKKFYHHEEMFIKKVFGYIHASKDGLSEKELLQILSEDLEDEEAFRKVIINEYHEAIKVTNPRRDNKEEYILPISVWSRLHTQIKPFIIERNIDGQPLMKFFHRQFTSVVEELYTEDEKEALHTRLADYFLTLQDTTKTWDKRYNNLHMLDEMPYQLFHASDSDRLKEILFDLEFAGSIYDHYKQEGFRNILEKSTELKGITEEMIYPWESFYREKEHLIAKVDEKKIEIDKNGKETVINLWRPHQSLYQLAFEDGLNSPLTEKAQDILNKDRINFYFLKNEIIHETFIRSSIKEVCNINENIIDLLDYKKLYIAITKDGSIFTIDDSFAIRKISSNNKIPIKGKLLHGNILNVWYGDGRSIIYNLDSLKIIETIKYEKAIIDVILIDDNKFITSSDKNTFIWNFTDKLNVIKEFEKYRDLTIKGLKKISSDSIIIWYGDGTFMIYDLDGNAKLDEPANAHEKSIIDVILIDDNKFITSSDKNTFIWNFTVKLNVIKEFEKYQDLAIKGLKKISSDSIIIWYGDGTFMIYDLDGKAKLDKPAIAHEKSIKNIFKISDNIFGTWSFSSDIKIWDQDYKNIYTHTEHSKPIKGIINLSNNKIISWSNDNKIMIWDINSKDYTQVLFSHTNTINGIYKVNDKHFISYDSSGQMIFWDVQNNSSDYLAYDYISTYNTSGLIASSGRKHYLFDDNNLVISEICLDNHFAIEEVHPLKENIIILKSINNIILWNILLNDYKLLSLNYMELLLLDNGSFLCYSGGSDQEAYLIDHSGNIIKNFKEDVEYLTSLVNFNNNSILGVGTSICVWDDKGKLIQKKPMTIGEGYYKDFLKFGEYYIFFNDKNAFIFNPFENKIIQSISIDYLSTLEVIDENMFITSTLKQDAKVSIWSKNCKLISDATLEKGAKSIVVVGNKIIIQDLFDRIFLTDKNLILEELDIFNGNLLVKIEKINNYSIFYHTDLIKFYITIMFDDTYETSSFNINHISKHNISKSIEKTYTKECENYIVTVYYEFFIVWSKEFELIRYVPLNSDENQIPIYKNGYIHKLHYGKVSKYKIMEINE